MDKETDRKNTYGILIKGPFDHSFTGWTCDIQDLPQENGETLLVGLFPDQAALRGFLEQLWNLNYTVLSINPIEHERSG